MTQTLDILVYNEPLRKAREDKAHAERNIQSIEAYIAEHNNYIAEATFVLNDMIGPEFIKALTSLRENESSKRELENMFLVWRDERGEAVRCFQNDVRRAQSNLGTYQAQFKSASILEAKLVKNENNVFDWEVINTQLSKNSKYKKKSLVLAEPGTISFIMTKLWLHPLHVNSESLIGGRVPLGDIRVTIHLQNMSVTIACTNKGATGGGAQMYTSGRTPHPHILSNDRPCFGDYQGPVAEALQSNSIITVFEVIQDFLEHCDPQDPAGRTWFRLLMRHGMDAQTTSLREEYDRRHPKWERRMSSNGEDISDQVSNNQRYKAMNLSKRCEHPDYVNARNPHGTGRYPIAVTYDEKTRKPKWCYLFDTNTWYEPTEFPRFENVLNERARKEALAARKQERIDRLNTSALVNASPLATLKARELHYAIGA